MASGTNPQLSSQPNLIFETAGKLEADTLFKSPYYPDSYKFPYNPDSLVKNNNYSVYDEMRDDDQVKVALNLKKDLCLNQGWRIVCDDEKIVEFITQNLKDMGLMDLLESSFEDSLRGIMSAYEYGFSISEPIYKKPSKTKSGMWELVAIKVRPPHSFIFHINDYGDTEYIEQITDAGSIRIDPDMIIHHVYQPDFGNPYGKSDLKAAHPAWKAKKFIFRMAMRYAERFAGALAVGRYQPNMTRNEINQFSTMLQSLQDNSSFVMPESAKVELVQVARDSSDSYEKILNMTNMWIARALLVPDLIGLSGSKTSGGSYSLGKEQFKIFVSTLKSERNAISRKLTLKCIQPLVNVNFGDIPCEFQFEPIETDSETELMRLWLDAVNGRLFKPSEEEINHLRKKTGFPEGPVELQEDSGPEEESNLQGDGEKASDSVDEDIEDKKKEFSRQLTAYEAKMDFDSLKNILESSEERFSKELSGIARKITRDILTQAKDKGIVSKFRPEKMDDLKPRFLKEMNDAVRGHFVSMFRDGVKFAKKEIMGVNAAKFSDAELDDEDFERLVRADSFKLVRDLSQRLLKDSTNILSDGIKSGKTEAEITAKLMEHFDDVQEHHIRTIVRTRATEVLNASRKSYFDNDPIASDIVVGYQYSAILDDRTTEVCERLHGKSFSKEEAEYLSDITPPTHWNAIAKGVMVDTICGQRPIEKIQSGDFVKTHQGRFARVYDTMTKRNEFDFVLELVTDKGTVALTPDHPVLTQGHWIAAGDIRIGDHVFYGRDTLGQTNVIMNGIVSNAKHSVSKVFEYLCSGFKRVLSFAASPAANFNNQIRLNNKISDKIVNDDLKIKRNSGVLNRLFQNCLRFCGILLKSFGNAGRYLDPGNFIGRWIVRIHPFTVFGIKSAGFLSLSKLPGLKIGPSSNSSQGHCGSLSLAPNLDAITPTGIGKDVYTRKAHRPGDRSEGLTFTPVAILDHGVENDGIVDINNLDYIISTVVRQIRKTPYSGMVYNLAVEGDESYLAGGIVVHNCRSLLVPITRFEEPHFDKTIPIEKLQKMGGNLIFKEREHEES